MRLFHDPASTTSRVVTLFIADEGLDVDPVHVSLSLGEHLTEDFLGLNPNGQVPVLLDGELVLTESLAILRYLAEGSGSRAWPAEAKRRALVEARLAWFATGFARDVGLLVYPQILPQMAPPSAEVGRFLARHGRQAVERWLTVLDRDWIGERAFVCGEAITLADYLGIAHVTLLEAIAFDFTPWPNVRRWVAAMKQRPGWPEANAAFDGLLAALAAQARQTA
jgi:glutathione S-transferase